MYCKKCGSFINDDAKICYYCGYPQNDALKIEIVKSTPIVSSSQNVPVAPLVLGILALVFSIVSLVFSLLIVFVMPMIIIAVASLTMSIISMAIAASKQKSGVRSGKLVSAKIVSIIALVQSVLAVIIGILLTMAFIKTFGPYSNPDHVQNDEATREPLTLIGSGVTEIKYGIILKDDGTVYCFNPIYTSEKIVMLQTEKGAEIYGVGTLAKQDGKYLNVYKLNKDVWGKLKVDKTITFMPDGEILYVEPGVILYKTNDSCRIMYYDGATGSINADNPIVFFAEKAGEKQELCDLDFVGIYRSTARNADIYSSYTYGESNTKLAFSDSSGKLCFVTVPKDSKPSGETVEFNVKTEAGEKFKRCETGDLFENVAERLIGRIENDDTKHVSISLTKKDVMINLPDQFKVENITGIELGSDRSAYSNTDESEWSVTDEKQLLIVFNNNSLYYNVNSASVKGIELKPYEKTNNEIKDRNIVRIMCFNGEYIAEDDVGNVYSMILK